jgi:hypothetical protein
LAAEGSITQVAEGLFPGNVHRMALVRLVSATPDRATRKTLDHKGPSPCGTPLVERDSGMKTQIRGLLAA